MLKKYNIKGKKTIIFRIAGILKGVVLRERFEVSVSLVPAEDFPFAIPPLPHLTGLLTEQDSTNVIPGALRDAVSSFSAVFSTICAFATK